LKTGYCRVGWMTGRQLDPLPKPPGKVGCYLGTRNGWLAVPCIDPHKILPGFHSFDVSRDGLVTVPPVGSAIPIVYGQVESTMLTGSETSGGTANNNQWGVYLNSNWFPCPSPYTGTCWDQFIVAADGNGGNTAVCIESWRGGTAAWSDQNFCVGANGQTESAGGTLDWVVTTRVGALQAGDFGNVAAYAYTVNGNALLGMVAQFSWVSNQDIQPASETDLPNRIPGLYSVVTPDQYGLAQAWTNVAGGFLGMDNGAQANFTNAEVMNLYAISDCQDDVSAAGPTCPGSPVLSSTNVQYQADATAAETNNLALVATPALAFPNNNLAVTEVLASTNSGACLSGVPNHLFIRDNDGDNGGVPSNVGGIPFWESPDIFVVPQGSAAPGLNDVPADYQLTAGQPYNVFLRVHNDYGCNAVTGPISVFIDGANPDLGFANWLPVTPGAATGQYTTFGTAGATIVPAFGAAIIGPFPWTPSAGGHKCLLAAIAAGNETPPPASATAPVLPPAYGSNQIAQRNLQIGSACSYNLTNTTANSVNLSLGVSVTPATPAPGSSGGPAISLTFADASSAFFNAYNGQTGITVTHSGSTTTVVLNTSYIALHNVPLPAGQSPSVSIFITPAANATPPSVDISSLLTDPKTRNIVQMNGGTCTSTGVVIPG
jgi:hypothetical protein